MGRLRENLKPYAMDNHFKKYGELNAKELEKIADDFAVNFGEWLLTNRNFFKKELTTKELLIIYKEENGI